MLLVPVTVKASNVHGDGLFAAIPLRSGAILWRFEWPDLRKPLEACSAQEMHFGYVNPSRPKWLVICGDDSKWWNFGLGHDANCSPCNLMDDGEYAIITTRDIAVGEELLISVDSDADAYRKIGKSCHVLDKELTHSFQR